ncbi:hypothetical protein [Deferribacter desulfuricans]|uniref:hypothetical protein n=1 Tax=Deferribacter desulfuricans TaxID=197162 RepID=UPI00031BB3AA|nr:hypothetical protein [Deferribacter desulfuricans]
MSVLNKEIPYCSNCGEPLFVLGDNIYHRINESGLYEVIKLDNEVKTLSTYSLNNSYYKIKKNFLKKLKEVAYNNFKSDREKLVLIIDEFHEYINNLQSAKSELLSSIVSFAKKYMTVIGATGTINDGRLSTFYSMLYLTDPYVSNTTTLTDFESKYGKSVNAYEIKSSKLLDYVKDINSRLANNTISLSEKQTALLESLKNTDKKAIERIINSDKGYGDNIVELIKQKLPPVHLRRHEDVSEINLTEKYYIPKPQEYSIDYTSQDMKEALNKFLSIALNSNVEINKLINSFFELLSVVSYKSMVEWKYEHYVKPTIQEALSNKEKIIVTSGYQKTQEYLIEKIQQDFGNIAEIGVYTASTKKQAEKTGLLDAVVNGDTNKVKQPDIFIASANMITTSLNARAYSKMIITEPFTYDIKVMSQLKARIRRLDSHCKNPIVYICAADIETNVLKILNAKNSEMEGSIISLLKHKETDPFAVVKQVIEAKESIYDTLNTLTGQNSPTQTQQSSNNNTNNNASDDYSLTDTMKL